MNGANYKARADAAIHDCQTRSVNPADIAYGQLNATLHLANQQHIANLLAYQALHPNAHTTLDNRVADQITEAMSA